MAIEVIIVAAGVAEPEDTIIGTDLAVVRDSGREYGGCCNMPGVDTAASGGLTAFVCRFGCVKFNAVTGTTSIQEEKLQFALTTSVE